MRFPDTKGNFFTDYTHNTVRGLFTRITQRNTQGITNVITNSAEYGLIPQRDFFDKDIAVDGNTSNYYVIKSGDFVYNPRKSNQAPYGPFNCYNYMDEGIVSPLYTCLRPKIKEYTEFLLWYFKSSVWHSYIYHNGSQEGARHDRVGMTTKLMDGIPINLPDISEQQKIVSFLNLIERKIAIQSKLVDLLKLYKRGLLSKLFPQNGESRPQYRFKGFTNAWEQRKLSEVLISLQNNNLSRAELSANEGVAKNVHYGDILVKFGEVLVVGDEQLPMIKDGAIVAKYKTSFLQNGDVIIADTAEDETVGKCTEIAGLDDETVISGLHTIPYRPLFEFASGYLGYYMNSTAYHSQLLPLMQGIKVTSISRSAMQSTDIVYPKSVDEQHKIGDYFRTLDHLITFHQEQYYSCEKIKLALLQKMFI